MEKKDSNKLVIILLVIIIIILGILCFLFATDKIILNNNNEEIINDNVSSNSDSPKEDNNNVIDNQSNSVVSKLVDNLNSGDSEITFNNISVSIKQSSDSGMCYASEINVNGENIKSKNMEAYCVYSYEIYNDNVIFFNGSTSNTAIYIYNTNTKSFIFDSSINEIFKVYKIKSYFSSDNKLSINAVGCGLQCGVDNENVSAIFEIYYENGMFSEPVLVN